MKLLLTLVIAIGPCTAMGEDYKPFASRNSRETEIEDRLNYLESQERQRKSDESYAEFERDNKARNERYEQERKLWQK